VRWIVLDGRWLVKQMEFKPCPFCGGDPKINHRVSLSGESKTGFVWFATCYCGGYSATAWKMADSEEELAKKWNSRYSGGY
jgi:Lar family restriction alleviation protein